MWPGRLPQHRRQRAWAWAWPDLPPRHRGQMAWVRSGRAGRPAVRARGPRGPDAAGTSSPRRTRGVRRRVAVTSGAGAPAAAVRRFRHRRSPRPGSAGHRGNGPRREAGAGSYGRPRHRRRNAHAGSGTGARYPGRHRPRTHANPPDRLRQHHRRPRTAPHGLLAPGAAQTTPPPRPQTAPGGPPVVVASVGWSGGVGWCRRGGKRVASGAPWGGVGLWGVGGWRRVALPCSCAPRFPRARACRRTRAWVSGPVWSSVPFSVPGHAYPRGRPGIPAHPSYVRVTLRLVPGRTGTSPRARGICPERPPTLR